MMRRTWRPLSLYWRRRRRSPVRTLIRSAITRAVTNVSWLPQFHLHFAMHPTAMQRGGQAILPVRLSVETRTGRIACPPLVLVHRQTSLHASTLRMLRSASFTTRVFRSESSKSVTDARSLFHALETRFSSLRSFLATHRSEARTLAAALPRMQREVETRLRLRDRTVLRQRERNTIASSSSTNTILTRPPELVYRRELRTRSEIETRHSVAPVAVQQSQAEPRVAMHAASARTASQAPAIDLDRLTEDVIRRVEKRVRIERERRGL
jgi:hypothetical protein